MNAPDTPAGLPESTAVASLFIRGRNVMLTIADFTPLYTDFYIHLQEQEIRCHPAVVDRFKDFLAAFTLHAASHPRNEVLSWTLHFQNPNLNFFFAADTKLSSVTGRFFTEGLTEESSNWFYQDLVIAGKPMRRSIVAFDETDAAAVLEHFYAQSEQRPARLFRIGGDRFALLSAHPDWDMQWFGQLDVQQLGNLQKTEHLQVLEQRLYRWWCGCSMEKILQILQGPIATDPHGLFGEDAEITVKCPRCASRYRVARPVNL